VKYILICEDLHRLIGKCSGLFVMLLCFRCCWLCFRCCWLCFRSCCIEHGFNVCFLFVAMSDLGEMSSDIVPGSSSQDGRGNSSDIITGNSSNEDSLKRAGDKRHVDDPPDVSKKRPRGPYDCLNWDDSDEDEVFTPYTQENPKVVHTPIKVFAKKSSGRKGGSKKSSTKINRAKNSGSSRSKEKGKSLGKCILFVWVSSAVFILRCFKI
jgi:hypothetical protein